MKFITLAFATLSLAALIGCGNTATGVSKDTAENSQKAAEGADNMGKGVGTNAKNVEAATMLTPKVKLAITADKKLNDSQNMINVESTSDKVMLEGHVTTAELKTLAGNVAQKVLTDNNAGQTLVNNLEVKM